MTNEAVVKADMAGALAGALDYAFTGSSITGLMFGPGGAVLCCAAYVVKGAIISSGVGAILELIW